MRDGTACEGHRWGPEVHLGAAVSTAGEGTLEEQ